MRAGVIALAVVLAGCGASQPAPAPHASVAAARDRLVRRCMAAHGFSFPAPKVTPAFRRALLGSPRQIGTLRLSGGVIVRYRTHGCYPHAIGVLYGSVRRYQQIVAARNMLGSEVR
jgi:hypothetical protein